MANYLVTDTQLTSVANAIRTKTGGSSGLSFPDGFVSGIGGITVGSPDVWDGFGKNPTLIYTYDQSLKLSETSYNSSNVSSSSTDILASNTLNPITIDNNNYVYYVLILGSVQYQYNTEENIKPYILELKQEYARTQFGPPYDTTEWSDLSTSSWSDNQNTNFGNVLIQYMASAGTARLFKSTSTSISNGINFYWNAPGYSDSLIYLKTPTIRVQLASSYFSQEAANAIDINNTRINYTIKLYQYDKGSSQREQFIYQLANYSSISDQAITLENGNTLTDESGNNIIYNTLTN